ncbi:hypothetical protein ACGFX4_05340 [Kitasatospora sp. NPDC048365]|uniref:hypothetical protein n=1 Tax=Kitasatospora sp. NPDC048365 TaxID=3364050 RepID=UPI00371E6645
MKKLAVRVATAALAIPALIFGMSGTSYANSDDITWRDDATGLCLAWDINPINGFINWVGTRNCDSGRGYTRWRDVWDGSAWREKPAYTNSSGNWVDICLTAWKPGSTGTDSVYFEDCSANNPWQQWQELQIFGGWHLKHVQDGYLLDSNGGGSVYATADPGPGTNNHYQLWH